MKQFLTILGLFAGLIILPPVAVCDTYVTNTSVDLHDLAPGDGLCGDPGNPDSSCSMRAAIEEANANSGADTILLEAQVTPFRLRLGELLLIDDSTVLRGIGLPVLDGVNNPRSTDIIRIVGSHCRISGFLIQRARRHGIVIEADSNHIGGSSMAERNVFVACGIDDDTTAFAVVISGASGNVISHNVVGMRPDGLTAHANVNGIGLTRSAQGNLVGPGNVISGNRHSGLVLANCHNNMVGGNIIGPDLSGVLGPGNGSDGIHIVDGSTANRIGGYTLAARNLISANGRHGIHLSGHQTSGNLLVGNLIGLDKGGFILFGNAEAGVCIDSAASQNLIGDGQPGGTNVISGNYGDGIRIIGPGCVGNSIKGNFIGLDTSGYSGATNGQYSGHGIYIADGASQTVIGGADSLNRNVISGNRESAIFFDHAHHNSVKGNFIGISLLSQSSQPNGAGIVLRHGSSQNIIGGINPGEGNVISGNRAAPFPLGAGVAMYDPGTNSNLVVGNMIGTDDLGSRALRNGTAGVVIGDGARHNIIGGPSPAERNIISGNGSESSLVTVGRGVHIFGQGTDSNRVAGNYIGAGIDTSIAILNLGNGVGIYAGARHNIIGGDSPEYGNFITANAMHGIYLADSATLGNIVRHNRIRENDSLGIAIRRDAQAGILPPILTLVSPEVIYGEMASPGALVDLYLADPDPSGHGEGSYVIATAVASADGSFFVDLSESLSVGSVLTALQTDSAGNTSEFAQNVSTDLTTDVDTTFLRPTGFGLAQNFPNPFNPSTKIRFSLPRATSVRLDVFNLLGELVAVLVDRAMAAGEHAVIWDGINSQGRLVASGLYFYRLQTGSQTEQRKMLLLK